MMAQVSLTPTESKKLISKSILQLEQVKKTLKDGIIIVKKGTTNLFLVEEIAGRKITKNFCCGINTPKGACISNDSHSWFLARRKQRASAQVLQWVIKRGELREENPDNVLKEMDCDDVYVSGANALDFNGNAAMMVVAWNGGTIGRHLPVVVSQGIHHIIPVGLEKLIPVSIDQAVKEAGISKVKYAMARPYGLIPLYGRVITEVEAIKILTGATAVPICAGGVVGSEGSIHLVIKGDDQQVKKAWDMICQKIRGTKLPELKVPKCKECTMNCQYRGLDESFFTKYKT